MQNTSFKVAIIQLCSSRDVDQNIASADALIRKAALQGADYIQTPETTTLMELESGQAFSSLEPLQGNRHIAHFSKLAKTLEIWLHIGSMGIALEDGRMANRSFLFDPQGKISDFYDKIHMFDVDLPSGESYRESEDYRAGKEAVITKLPWGKLGMSICYDLRFPDFYRQMALQGASFFSIPAAFTKITGQAHWHILLRARAIENGCFVFAAAQGGLHENGRKTYGHSLIIDPWGRVLADAGDNQDIIMADIDSRQVEIVRAQIPVLRNERDVNY